MSVSARNEKQVENIQFLLKQKHLSHSDIVHLFSSMRIIIESNGWQEELLYLNTYCNWMLHEKLSRSMVCYRLLESVADSLIELGYLTPTSLEDGSFFKSVSSAFRILELRLNILAFLDRCSLPRLWFDIDTEWVRFFASVACILLDRRIEFPDSATMKKRPKIQAIYDEIRRKSLKADGFGAVRALWFTEHSSKALWWCVEMDHPTAPCAFVSGALVF